MKRSTDTYTCDLCGQEQAVVSGAFPVDWAKVETEQNWTFVEKHVCHSCVGKIKYDQKKGK